MQYPAVNIKKECFIYRHTHTHTHTHIYIYIYTEILCCMYSSNYQGVVNQLYFNFKNIEILAKSAIAGIYRTDFKLPI